MLHSSWSVARLEERRRETWQVSDVPLVGVALATGVGLLIERAIWPSGLPVVGLLLLSALLLVFWLRAWQRGRMEAATALLLGATVALAGGWSGFAWRFFPQNTIGRFAAMDAEPVCLEGIVRSRPLFYAAQPTSPLRALPPSDRSVFDLEVTQLRDGQTWRSAVGKCEVRLVGKHESLQPGSHVQLFGKLRSPSPASNPGERDASQADRAARRLGILWSGSPACVTRVGSNPPQEATGTLARMREFSQATLSAHLSPQNGPLARAMLLGDRSGVSREVADAFRRSGTLHVLVVSGMHVGIMAGLPLLLGMLGLVPRWLALTMSLLLVVGYTALVGAHPSALRAAILAAGAVLAAMVGRRPLRGNSLAGAAVVLFFVSPGAFAAAGTRLSFLAAATLLLLGASVAAMRCKPVAPLDRLVERCRPLLARVTRKALRWSATPIVATAAVLIVAGPLLASEFHLLSPVALPLALPISLLVLVILPGGLLLVCAELVSALQPDSWHSIVTSLPALLTDWGVGALHALVTWAATIPGGFFYTPGPAGWWVALWYTLLLTVLGVEVYAPRHRWLVLRAGLALMAAAFVPTLWQRATEMPAVRCTVIAVGHGSSVLLELPGGGAMLYDCGALGSPDWTADTIARVCWSRGIRRLDAVFLSHPDIDHYNALPGLLDRFPIDGVWTTRMMFEPWETGRPSAGATLIQEHLEQRGVPLHRLAMGDRLRSGDVLIEVLHPTDLGVLGSDNANSLVLGIEHVGRRVLLMGDLESPGLEYLLASEPYDCDLLIAPHHGSQRSDPPGLAAWCKPELVVASSGHAAHEAATDYRSHGALFLNTHTSGGVSITLGKKRVRCQTFLEAPIGDPIATNLPR